MYTHMHMFTHIHAYIHVYMHTYVHKAFVQQEAQITNIGNLFLNLKNSNEDSSMKEGNCDSYAQKEGI